MQACARVLPVGFLVLAGCHLAAGLDDYERGSGEGLTSTATGGLGGWGGAGGGGGGTGGTGGQGASGGVSPQADWARAFADADHPQTEPDLGVRLGQRQATLVCTYGGSPSFHPFEGLTAGPGDDNLFHLIVEENGDAATAGGHAGAQAGPKIATHGLRSVVAGRLLGDLTLGTTTLGPPAGPGADAVYVARFDAYGAPIPSSFVAFGNAQPIALDAIAADLAGTAYVVGSFDGSVDFGCGSLVAEAGTPDIYVAKLDLNDACVWSRRLRLEVAGSDTRMAVAVTDDAQSVFVAGHFEGTMGVEGTELTSVGQRDIFLVRYDSAGAAQAAVRYGDEQDQVIRALAAGPSARIALVGEFSGTLQLDSLPPLAGGTDDMFVAVFEGSLTPQWAAATSGDGVQHMYDVAFDARGVAATGSFSGTVNFGSVARTSAGDEDVFYARWDESGVNVMAGNYGDERAQRGTSIAVESGETFVAGEYLGTITFNPNYDLLEASSEPSVFLAKFAPLPQ